MPVIVCGDAVLDYHSITIAVFIIVVYEVVLVFFVFLRLEFLGAKESAKGVHLVQFLQSTTAKHTAFNLLGLDILITIYIYAVYLCLEFLVDVNVKDYVVLFCCIVTLTDSYLTILKALIGKVFLCQNLGSGNHIRSNLRAFEQSELGLHVFALFLFLDADIVYLTYPWTGAKIEM